MNALKKYLGLSALCLCLSLGTMLHAQSKTKQTVPLQRTESVIKWLREKNYSLQQRDEKEAYIINFKIGKDKYECVVMKDEDYINVRRSSSLPQDIDPVLAYMICSEISAIKKFARCYIRYDSSDKTMTLFFDSDFLPEGNSVSKKWLQAATKSIEEAEVQWRVRYKNALEIITSADNK